MYCCVAPQTRPRALPMSLPGTSQKERRFGGSLSPCKFYEYEKRCVTSLFWYFYFFFSIFFS